MIWQKRVGLSALLAVCLISARPASGEEAALVYKDVPTPAVPTVANTLSRMGMPAGYTVASKAPAAIKKLPRFMSATPLFVKVPIGASFVILAFDKSRRAAPDYDVLYVDANSNGDLTDETPQRWKPEPGGSDPAQFLLRPLALFGGGFSSVKLTALIGGAPRPYVLNCTLTAPEVIGQGKTRPRECIVWGLGRYRWEGSACFGDRTVLVALEDGNSNGRFHDLYRMAEDERGGDGLLVDLNGNGEFDSGSTEEASEWMFLGQPVNLEGGYYQTSVVQREGVLFLAVESAPLGTIRCNYEEFGLDLIGDNGLTLMVKGERGSVQVPAGNYHVGSWSAFKTDQLGRKWHAYEELTLNRPRLSLRAGETIPLQLPSTFFGEAKVFKTLIGTTFGDNGKIEKNEYIYNFELGFKSDKQQKLDFESGALNGVNFWVDDKLLKARLRIVDAKNNTIARLTMDGDFRGWQAPEAVKGKLRAFVELDESPFPITVESVVTFDVGQGSEAK